ncbi:hypothetical protein A3K86_21555 [Photobacterium jeanii]|uniref:Copper resistance protein n=1 Tax=Photobacterium jeanii TaxID=858640 RepID=A0A178K355_9GAMM|nr:hypothetical protein [Photobacterium jeanii]OAN11517.1 hypothetical protein A3K86_21555 [Photobacterium jeanii]PST91035.1 hypothetical protein C9I91_10660 [Photobacterium jeanii]
MTFIRYPSSSPRIAKFILAMVCLVILVCLSQRAGWSTTCPNSHFSSSDVTSSSSSEVISSARTHDANIVDSSNAAKTELTQDEAANLSEQCEMTDHLLQLHLQSLELGLLYLPFIFILLSLLYIGHTFVPTLTEPIPETRRRHLTLCVFRE